MSLKEFFNQPILKTAVIDFLRNRADFDTLPYKLKKPFRCQLQKTDSLYGLDGYNSIRVVFSQACKDEFAHKYPESMKIEELDGTLVVIHKFKLLVENSLSQMST